MNIIIVKRLRDERKVVARFRQEGACSVETSRPLGELDLQASPAFYRLQRFGVFVHTGSNRYFLDEKQLVQYRLNRVKWAMIILFLGLLLLLWWVPRMK